jgi:hypothetical protein
VDNLLQQPYAQYRRGAERAPQRDGLQELASVREMPQVSGRCPKLATEGEG